MEDLCRRVRPVAGVPTFITDFVGRALRGPIDMSDGPDLVPAVIHGYVNYE